MPKKNSKDTNQGDRRIAIVLHPTADAELERMDAEDRAHVYEFIERINGKPYLEVVRQLDDRTDSKVFQKERSARRGTMRIVFHWGSEGTLWFIGAFVKNNDKQGERFAARILRRSEDIEAYEHDKGTK